MRFKRYDNDPRFWFLNTKFGRVLSVMALIIIAIAVVLKVFGFVD
jgi:hypothetical protein